MISFVLSIRIMGRSQAGKGHSQNAKAKSNYHLVLGNWRKGIHTLGALPYTLVEKNS